MFGKFCLRVFVGLVVFLVFGGKDGLGLLMMTVVCTAGVGLIVVIPAAYLLGLLCTIWFIPFGSRGGGQEVQSAELKQAQTAKARLTYSLAERHAIEGYIAAAEAKGELWQSIRAALIRSGWDSAVVDHVKQRWDKTKERDY